MRDIHLLPFVSLLLILCVVVAILGPPRRGLFVKFPIWTVSCDDSEKIVVVKVLPDGRVRLNADELSLRDLGPKLHEIFRWRTKRVVFITASRETAFQHFVLACEIAQHEADHIAFMTIPWEAVENYFLGPDSKACYSIPLDMQVDANSTKPILEIKEVPLVPWD